MRSWKYRAALGFALVAMVFAATHGIRAELPQAIGTWAALGTAPDNRVGAAAVALADGRTLITGGSVDGIPTDVVVAFDPNDGSFSTIGHLTIARVGHTGDASASGPHLHFAINTMAGGERWWQGTPINPYPLLAGT